MCKQAKPVAPPAHTYNMPGDTAVNGNHRIVDSRSGTILADFTSGSDAVSALYGFQPRMRTIVLKDATVVAENFAFPITLDQAGSTLLSLAGNNIALQLPAVDADTGKGVFFDILVNVATGNTISLDGSGTAPLYCHTANAAAGASHIVQAVSGTSVLIYTAAAASTWAFRVCHNGGTGWHIPGLQPTYVTSA
jgi:hypothetical protein